MVNILQFFLIQFHWQRVFPCWQMFSLCHNDLQTFVQVLGIVNLTITITIYTTLKAGVHYTTFVASGVVSTANSRRAYAHTIRLRATFPLTLRNESWL